MFICFFLLLLGYYLGHLCESLVSRGGESSLMRFRFLSPYLRHPRYFPPLPHICRRLGLFFALRWTRDLMFQPLLNTINWSKRLNQSRFSLFVLLINFKYFTVILILSWKLFYLFLFVWRFCLNIFILLFTTVFGGKILHKVLTDQTITSFDSILF